MKVYERQPELFGRQEVVVVVVIVVVQKGGTAWYGWCGWGIHDTR